MIELSSSIEEAAKKIILEAGFVAKKLKKKLSIKYKSESQPVTNVDLAIDNLDEFFNTGNCKNKVN